MTTNPEMFPIWVLTAVLSPKQGQLGAGASSAADCRVGVRVPCPGGGGACQGFRASQEGAWICPVY